MAEGKHLLTVSSMHRSGLLSADGFERAVGDSLRRLEAMALDDGGGGCAWGLGFAWRGAPADEPYLITTSIVGHGLVDALGHDEQLDARILGLLGPALRWLLVSCPTVPWHNLRVPAYSPHNRRPIRNTTAYWAGTVLAAARTNLAGADEHPDVLATARLAAEAVLRSFTPSVGWTYSEDSTRVDLLHTCYVAAGLALALPGRHAEIDLLALTAILHFSDGGTWRDRFDIVDRADLLGAPPRLASSGARILGDVALVGPHVAARPWSLGELMVVAATTAKRQGEQGFWMTQLRDLAELGMREHLPARTFRQSMHLAHGLASVLETLRGAA